jgi:4-cresol dehydrogenase (hydroxylating)
VLEENAVSIWNAYKLLACQGRYPWKLSGGRTPLALGPRAGRAAWYTSGLLHAESGEHAQALRALVEPALREVVQDVNFVDMEGSAAPVDVPGLLGAALDSNVRMAYWRKRTPQPARMDPDRDRCGIIWICPMLPLDGGPVVEAIRTAEETISAASFEPMLAMQCVSPRAVHAFFAIVYDRDVEGEDERAMACHDVLMERLVARGHLPYRLGAHSMDALPPSHDGSQRLLRALKQALDPADVLAPGHYDVRPD